MGTRLFLISLFLLTLMEEAQSAPASKNKRKEDTKTSIEQIGTDKAPSLQEAPPAKHFLELRPTLNPVKGEFHTENLIQIGLGAHDKAKWSYVQYFDTNLYNPQRKRSILRKPRITVQDGYAAVRLSNLWENEEKNRSFSMQFRLYLPTNSSNGYPSRWKQGMIATLRNYFSIHQTFFDFIELDLALVPTFCFYTKSGYTVRNKDVANPVYDHLINQTTDIKITKDLLFTLPFVMRFTKNRDYSDKATLNNKWNYNLSALPEIDWALNSKHTIGAAFVTDNFLKPDGSGTRWNYAWKNGLVQVLWNFKF